MSLVIDQGPRSATRHRADVAEERALVVRFAGDSGDGVQLAGLQFAKTAAARGADLMTLPEFPAEIRAPAGTTFGVSAYQIQFGAGEVLTPGDDADVLIAFNPAAFATNIQFLKPGGMVVIDEGAFDKRAFAKAGLEDDPITPAIESQYRLIKVDISKRTLESVAAFELGRKDALRAKNFWALGLSLWLSEQTTDATAAWIKRRFAREPTLAGGNEAALRAGHAYGETMELAPPEAAHRARPAQGKTQAQMISGTEAMALGVAASGALAGRSVQYCSYPITPASALLHALAKIKTGVRTFQAEDEIAAVCAAIGASYGGALGVTASSGPGLSLKTEALGLAMAAELPLVVIDVQRAGPSTGMPTKPEQSDLDLAVFGRHGEAPLPVLAPATPADGFAIMVDAGRIAIEAMTPVIVLSDAYLANAVSEWVPPDVSTVPEITAAQPEGGRETTSAYARGPKTLARAWIAPGTPGLAYRVGGLEKDAVTGNISYDPGNHAAMVKLRADKIARLAERAEGAYLRDGPEEGDLLVIGWGSTLGPIRQAVRDLNADGSAIGHLHLRQLWPLPKDLEAIMRRYARVACVEMNTGQLCQMLRAAYLLPVEPIGQVNGRPFRVATLRSELAAKLNGAAS